jgi:hypothetical protein
VSGSVFGYDAGVISGALPLIGAVVGATASGYLAEAMSRNSGETAQDQTAVEDRPRVRAAQDRRATTIAAAKRRLRRLDTAAA